jgi:predicted DNA-binding antitoxin AbrB/MazE fold protein
MSQTLEATFDGQVFRPVQTVDLQPDTKVELIVTIKDESEKKTKSFLETARSLELKGPKDFSLCIDDYLYGGANFDDE